jgi:hypothetical protein
MDAKHAQLEKKLEELLKQTAEVSAQLQALDQGASVPHFDQIELPAHAVGQRLSRLIQTNRAREVAATTPLKVVCPDCGQACAVDSFNRKVSSMDGPVELTESVARCRHCRRSFFPSA